ncbi:LacI family DNA-binding transcriptional regulator [Streptomyces alfalfae]|uniref:LacI family DNA-binding transcriptional regulator n=1 Tax=Streptomyces alfalfae TaxID=1642299 RepID=A0A7T4PMA0_9ACTN|nr:LacI family DNA-binding transcriptional regulator [Streptomyces alfalfae]QQC92861.1 LacI family DNA-binding transcriptional regulator [Streptomyces alfalfae]QUI35166.1 LacI family DNA-binding transcriptional regulator [Streptomyces alfalfae]
MVQIPKKEPARRSVPTSADVARLAGVSRATVSYVLNNTSAVRISEPTRRRVHAAARELGYVPHAAARSLRAGHSRMVLMPTSETPLGPLLSQFFNELQWALSRLDYTVVQYASLGMTGEDAARAWAELRPVAVLAPDASALGPRGVEVLKRSGAKAVFTLGPQRVEGAHALLMDGRRVGEAAALHLLARGRRRIGAIVPEEPGLEIFSEPRVEGLRKALRAVRITGASLTEVPLAYDEASAARLAARWRSLGLDGVFAYNDEYAMLLLRALQDEGVAVPDETAVVGSDDLMLGRLLRPRLSTVRIELPSGRGLAELVDRVVRDPGTEPEVHDVLGADVVHRESS